MLNSYENWGPNPLLFSECIIYIYIYYILQILLFLWLYFLSISLGSDTYHTPPQTPPPTPRDTDGWPQGRRRNTAPFPMDTHKQSVGRLSVSRPRPGQGSPACLGPSRPRTPSFSSTSFSLQMHERTEWDSQNNLLPGCNGETLPVNNRALSFYYDCNIQLHPKVALSPLRFTRSF